MPSSARVKVALLKIDQVDGERLELVGRVALRHAHLDYILRLRIKSLSGEEYLVAIRKIAKMRTSALRSRVESVALEKFGEGEALDKLRDILKRCEDVSEARHRVLHDIWVEDDGEVKIRREGHSFEAMPTVAYLRDLDARLESLANELNVARNTGFIATERYAKK